MAISISFSKLSTFMSCKLKYSFSYVKNLEIEKTISSSQQLGKYIHKVLEDYREGLDITELAKLYEGKYVIAAEEKKVIPGMLETAKMYYEPYAGLQYESELSLNHTVKDPHGERDDVKLTGIIDKLYYHPDGKLSIIDFKTGKVKSDNSLQMKFYTYILNKERNIIPENMECKIFYLRLKQNVPYSFNAEDLTEFENFITNMVEVIQNTSTYKHNFGYWCSYCDYRGVCEPFKAKKELNSYSYANNFSRKPKLL